MAQRFRGFLVTAAVTAGFAASFAPAGCYGWSLGSAPAEAGAHEASSKIDAADAGRREASTSRREASSSSSSTVDAGGPEVDAPPPVDTGSDVPPSPRECTPIDNAVDAARLRAEECMASVHIPCSTVVHDGCGCAVFVGVSDSDASTAYQGAVRALQEAGCARGCPDACPAQAKCAICNAEKVNDAAMSMCVPCSGPLCSGCPL
jgi:hypothetical protein